MYDEDRGERAIGDNAIGRIDEQIDFLEKNIEVLNNRLEPVLSRYDTEKIALDAPEPEPASALRGRADRLRRSNARLENLVSQLDL